MMSSATRARLRVGACLSLTGRYGRFGRQAAAALDVLQVVDGSIDLVVEDDKSDRRCLAAQLPDVGRRSDLLLGPYSTQLVRTAGQVVADEGWLLWNHGGSGDDVEAAHPGHLVSVLTPTSRYAEPFLDHVIRRPERVQLWIIEGRGSFGRQVASGAMAQAKRLGIELVRVGPDDGLPDVEPGATWDVFSAGTFEDDVDTVRRVHDHPHPPRLVCAVAAGVRDFADEATDPEGILGIAQWFPGSARVPQVGPTEADFLAAYTKATGGSTPDYPAAQAVAAALLATHCARLVGSTEQGDVWSAATQLDTSTLFGEFKIDPTTGTQMRHSTVLTRWTDRELSLA